MTTEEAIKIINKAIIESENVIAELSKIKALAERKSTVEEFRKLKERSSDNE